MKRTFYGILAMVFGSLVLASPGVADERAEIKQKMEALRAEARELANHGDEDAASERMKMVRELSAQLRILANEEPLADRHRSHNAEREKELHGLAKRLDQMRAAAQHLKEAQMPDMAHEVGRRADELEHTLRVEKERFAVELQKRDKLREVREKMPPVVAQRLKEEEAREEQEVWGRKVKEELVRYSEVINDIRAEQEKMRREFKELRQLIERLRKDKERS
jgi:hypothetical protein